MQMTKNKPFSVGAEKGSKQFNARANGRNVHPSHDNSIPQKNKKSNSFNANRNFYCEAVINCTTP